MTGSGAGPAQEDEPEQDSFELSLRQVARLRDSDIDALELPSSGELVGGKYCVDELLAVGGMGAVFRATHTVSGKVVALKWLLPSVERAAARFLREARAAARIDHPNVVDVYDLGSHRGGRYLVMELLRGRSLGARMRAGRMEPRELVTIMIPLLRGVAAAHAHGVVHRDLKPDNLFVVEGPDGSRREPKVLDFGISMLRVSKADTERLTSSGTAIGTPAYMSPEQLVDARNVDERTDIYAAGVIMYEALTGRLPFVGEGRSAQAAMCSADSPLPLRRFQPSVPLALERVVLKAMAREADDRHDSVEGLIAELAPFLAAPGRDSAPAPTVSAPRWLTAAALGLIAIVAALAQVHALRGPARATQLAVEAPSLPSAAERRTRPVASLQCVREAPASPRGVALSEDMRALPSTLGKLSQTSPSWEASGELASALRSPRKDMAQAAPVSAVAGKAKSDLPERQAAPKRAAQRGPGLPRALPPKVAPRAGRIDLTDL